MITIPMPTKDIPVDPSNLSPALHSMVAWILTPNAWGRVMGDSVVSVNQKCKATVKHIDK
jgi:hypothetical protein